MAKVRKYSINQIFTFSKFLTKVITYDVADMPFDTLSFYAGSECFAAVTFHKDHLYPNIWCRDAQKVLGLHYSIYFVNQKKPERVGSEKKGYLKQYLYGDALPLSYVKDEKNGIMKNGRVKIKVSVSIESITPKGGPSLFCLNLPPFKYKNKPHTISLKVKNETLCISKQLGLFHSSKLQGMIGELKTNIHIRIPNENINIEHLTSCFQILQGVSLQITGSDLWLLDAARMWKMTNVIRYCEKAILQDFSTFSKSIRSIHHVASFHDMRHLMSKLLEDIDTAEKLKEIVSKMKLDSMSGEIMKQITRRFFSYAVDYRNHGKRRSGTTT